MASKPIQSNQQTIAISQPKWENSFSLLSGFGFYWFWKKHITNVETCRDVISDLIYLNTSGRKQVTCLGGSIILIALWRKDIFKEKKQLKNINPLCNIWQCRLNQNGILLTVEKQIRFWKQNGISAYPIFRYQQGLSIGECVNKYAW